MPTDEDRLRLKEQLLEMDLPSEVNIDVLTSVALWEKVMPVLTPFISMSATETGRELDTNRTASEAFVSGILENFQSPDDLGKLIDDLANGVVDTAAINAVFKDLHNHWFMGPILAVLLGFVHAITTATGYFGVSTEKTRLIANEQIRPFMLDLDTLMVNLFRDPNQYGATVAQMRKMGISDDKITTYIMNARTFLPIEALRVLYFRGKIDEKELTGRLRALKIPDEDHRLMKTVMQVFPGVQDLVRFAVREVFNPELADQLGLLEDLPSAFVEESKKAGLSEDHTKMYWGAHWTPPGINQAFEMFHRGVIPEEELYKLLKINDYMPNYRDKLVKIAYRPITRVDLRRIYEDGFITYERLISGYMDLGYSPENAELISEWVDARYGEDRKDLAKSDILKLYKLAAYDRDQAYQSLRELGYTEVAARELLWKIDLDKAEKDKGKLIKLMRKAYIKGSLSNGQIIGKLIGIGMTTPEAEDLIGDWESEVAAKTRFLTPGDLKNLYKKGIWAETKTAEYLDRIGFTLDDIEALIFLWDTEMEEKT